MMAKEKMDFRQKEIQEQIYCMKENDSAKKVQKLGSMYEKSPRFPFN